MHKASEFDYALPVELIAQEPLADRGASRLLVLERASGAVTHRRFADLTALIHPEDVVVLNASKVIPARLHGERVAGSGERRGRTELLLVRECPDGAWLAMGHPGGKLKPGRRVVFGDDSAALILEVLGGGLRRIRFVGALDARGTLARYGEVPLPPYINRPPTAADRERYQTVYAAHEGSVATLDLHIGPGTFKPVDVEDLARHPMHAEIYAVNDAAAALINERRTAGGAVWAVGTTVVRTLETVADAAGRVQAGAGETRLFIYPPYRCRAVDRLLTNFHLPRSTLLMLVCAFGGFEGVMRAYGEAVNERYRFYSYGDAMLVI